MIITNRQNKTPNGSSDKKVIIPTKSNQHKQLKFIFLEINSVIGHEDYIQ